MNLVLVNGDADRPRPTDDRFSVQCHITGISAAEPPQMAGGTFLRPAYVPRVEQPSRRARLNRTALVVTLTSGPLDLAIRADETGNWRNGPAIRVQSRLRSSIRHWPSG